MIATNNPTLFIKQEALPECCELVPVVYEGIFNTETINHQCLETLKSVGSMAAPGFKNPEGVVVHHVPSGVSFKVTLEKDGERKGGL